MRKSSQRVPIPAVIGRRVLSAYIFNDEPEAHGVVLSLDDGSDLSVEFSHEPRVAANVIILESEDDEAIVLKMMD